MNERAIVIILICIAAINLYAVIITLQDKRLARSGGRRIPEKRLFIVAFLGGAPAMYITMRKIRHKTRHKRFMAGLPLIMLVELALAAFAAAKHFGIIIN